MENFPEPFKVKNRTRKCFKTRKNSKLKFDLKKISFQIFSGIFLTLNGSRKISMDNMMLTVSSMLRMPVISSAYQIMIILCVKVILQS